MNPAELNYQPVATFEKYEQEPLNHRMEKGTEMITEKGSAMRQFAAGLIVNIASIVLGCCLGWTSPMTPVLDNNSTFTSPLEAPPTTSESSWIGSLVALGALIAPFIAGPLAQFIGRKWTLLGSTVFFVVGWILLLTTSNVGMILAARIIQGFGVGFVMTVQPMYVGEIASNEYRGALGSLMQLCIVTGILYVYAIGPYVSYVALQWACLVLPIVFAVSFFFMPETPAYYISKGQSEAASKSLQWLRGKSEAGIQEELKETTKTVEDALSNKASVMDLFRSKGNRKALVICCGLLIFQQLSGINIVLFYSQTIFAKTGTDMSAAISTILVGIVQVLASGATPLIVDRLGRKPILLMSAGGMAVAHALLGLFFYMDHIGSDSVSSITWLPIFSLIFFVTVYSMGFGPLPWAVLGEMFPANVKSFASSIAASACWILGFLVLQFFTTMDEAVGSHFSFWIFGICCVVAFIFTLLLLMETKGMGLQEIQDKLNA